MTYRQAMGALKKVYDSMRIKGFEVQECFHTIDEVIVEWAQQKEEIEALREENWVLKNRCMAFGGGKMCFFCRMECQAREQRFGTENDLFDDVEDAP